MARSYADLAGERFAASGNLGLVLSRLADYIESRNALTSKIKLAFTYPAIVTVVAFAIVIFLLSYVVPQVVSVFANTKQKLPTLTIIMLWLSDFVRNWGWLAAIVLVAIGVLIRNLLKQLVQPRGRRRFQVAVWGKHQGRRAVFAGVGNSIVDEQLMPQDHAAMPLVQHRAHQSFGQLVRAGRIPDVGIVQADEDHDPDPCGRSGESA